MTERQRLTAIVCAAILIGAFAYDVGLLIGMWLAYPM